MPAIEIAALRKEALQLAERVDGHAVEVLGQQFSYQDEGQRIALHAQSVRMLQTFRAVTKLVEEELHDGAAAVLRSLVEQNFVFTAVLKCPELMHRAVKDEEGEQYKALRGLSKLPFDCRPENMTNEVLSEAMALRGTAGFDAFFWAQKAGQEFTYQTLWRHLSFNAHGALHATNDYFEMADDGATVLRIRKTVLVDRSIDFVLTAIGILMECAGAMDRQPMTEQRRARRELLGTAWNGLRDRYYGFVEAMNRMGDEASRPPNATVAE